MFKVIVTEAVISKGYDGADALRYSDSSDGVRFRIGKRVYDSREESNYRWVNINVKAFNGVCERIKKMRLKEGSFINLIGRYDEDQWTDSNGNKRTLPVVIVDEIEYSGGARSGGDMPSADKEQSEKSQQKEPKQQSMPDSFEGYASFGDSNPFFLA